MLFSCHGRHGLLYGNTVPSGTRRRLLPLLVPLYMFTGGYSLSVPAVSASPGASDTIRYLMDVWHSRFV